MSGAAVKKGASRSTSRSHASLAVRAWVRLLEVHKLALADIRDELEGNVTLSRFDLLSHLDHEDGLTLAALSRKMLVTAGNLTGLVDRAERDGMVTREAVDGDRRATRVALTTRGRATFREAARRHERKVEAIFSSLTKRDQESLSELLGVLRAGLREANEEERRNR